MLKLKILKIIFSKWLNIYFKSKEKIFGQAKSVTYLANTRPIDNDRFNKYLIQS